MKPVTVDFETHGIELRPDYPPVPVGAAIRWPGKRSKYLAWGHPCENNTTKAKARRELRDAWRHPGGVLFHNAAFDLAVGEVHLDLPWLPWDRFEDTKLLAFLHNPYSRALKLKLLAEEHLGMPPDEQTMLRDWVVANVPEAKRKPKQWAAHIHRAPGSLAGRYAKGDTDRTLGLFDFYKPTRDAMPEAYERERRILEVLEEMSNVGFPVDPRIEQIYSDAPKQRHRVEAWLRRRLGVGRTFDLQKRDQLADAIEDAGMLDEWIETKTGKRSLAHEDFALVCQDKPFAAAMHQRGMMQTIENTFLRRWCDMYQQTGRVHVGWNSVAGDDKGARTGRLSSTPNAQNISKKGPEKSAVRNVVQVNLRAVVKAPRGLRLVVADYAQQEPRQAAHFAGGTIAQAYRDNPHLDFHVNTQMKMSEFGIELERDAAKTLGLALLYALGLDAMSQKMDNCGRQEASRRRKIFKKAMPEFQALDRELKTRWELGEPITTWGGRIVHCEPPSNGRNFAYRALNYICQGSSADQMKQAMIDYNDDPKREGSLILSVHDEPVVECEAAAAKQEAKRLVRHMVNVGPFVVPFTADVGIGQTWWGAKP